MLTLTDAGYQNASVTFTVTKQPGGDGLAHVGYINATGRDLGAVVVKGDLGVIDVGDTSTGAGFALQSLSVQSMGVVGAATGGPLTGGTLESNIIGALGSLKVAGDLDRVWIRASGNLAGEELNGRINAATIGGSVLGGSIFSSENLGAVKIGRDLSFNPDDGNGANIDGVRIASIAIGGSILTAPGATGSDRITIDTAGDIGSLSVKGNVIGQPGTGGGSAAVVITAGGLAAPGMPIKLAIGKIAIGGRVEYARIHAGILATIPFTADASIGAVTVGGDWIASSLTAGVQNLGADGMVGGGSGVDADNQHFGNGDDELIPADNPDVIARIASITIKGHVAGTVANGNHFGFVAQQIGSFKAGGFTATLTSATDPAIPLALLTDDVRVHEVS